MKSRVTGRVRRCSSFLLCLVVVGGCGGSGPGRNAVPGTPGAFTVRTVSDPGFSIALPKTWRSLDSRTALTSGRLRRFAQANPRLRAELRALAGPNSPIKLLAVDPTGQQNFRANMNVIQTRVPKDLSFQQLSKNEAAQIKLVSSVQHMRQAAVELPAGRALRLTYDVQSKGLVHQYFVKQDDLLYVLTYTTSTATAPRYAKIFDLSAHTFQLR